MVTDNQVRILMKLINQEKLLKTAAAKAGMSKKTARNEKRQPTELGKKHISPEKPTKNNKPFGDTLAAKLTFGS